MVSHKCEHLMSTTDDLEEHLLFCPFLPGGTEHSRGSSVEDIGKIEPTSHPGPPHLHDQGRTFPVSKQYPPSGNLLQQQKWT